MIGNPDQFEALGNRLGFRIVENTPDKVRLVWQGARFPAFLCLGMALLLLGVSIPIVQALLLRGFVGPAGSLWYFPLMNIVLFGIAIFLITQRRSIEIDSNSRQLVVRRQSLYRSIVFTVSFNEISKITLSNDQINSGFAVGGSTAAQTFAVPALRLVVGNGANVLLDRGSFKKLAEIGNLISERMAALLEVDTQMAEPLLKRELRASLN
ncbi:MAG: hypothetical protein EXR70_08525 [Deltaproteobacteria bacterium]|nr:hypothetical protein [Deltaproteobacteria bacterium]